MIMSNNEAVTQSTSRSNVISILEGIHSIFDKIIKPVNKATSYVRLSVLALMVMLIVADVTMRFAFKGSLVGAIEIQEFALVIVAFLSFSQEENNKSNIRVDIIVSHLPKFVRNIFDGSFTIIIGVLFTIISWQAILQIAKKSTQVSQALKLPVSFFIAIAVIGLILLTLTLYKNFLRTIIDMIKEKKTPYLLIPLFLGAALLLLPNYIASFSMSGLSLGVLVFAILFILMFLGMPIGYAMTFAGYLGLMLLKKNSVAVGALIGYSPYVSTASYAMAVLPMFMLMGTLAFYSGLSEGLFNAASKWLGKLPGGLAMAAVAGCAGFGAVCGDSLATAVTMSKVSLPEMQKKNYHPSIAAGSLAAGGTLGILIPPSIGFIIYAMMAEESVGKLFIAGIVPGIMLTLLFIGAIYIVAKRKPDLVPRGESYPLRERLASLKGIIGIVILFVLILGGMLTGIFSPNEGGAVGCFGAFLIALPGRKLSFRNIVKSIEETVSVTARLFNIIIGVGIFGYFLAGTRVPMLLADFVAGLPVDKYVVFAAVCVLYIILGCLMNVIPMMMLTLPSLLPTILALGFDPIWFGVILVILMEMGQITPPVGMNVFAISTTSGIPMQTIYKGILPFVFCMLGLIVILVLFPQLALFLPNLMY